MWNVLDFIIVVGSIVDIIAAKLLVSCLSLIKTPKPLTLIINLAFNTEDSRVITVLFNTMICEQNNVINYQGIYVPEHNFSL